MSRICNRALIEGVHVDALADQSRRDIGLEVGEGEDEVRLKGEDLRDVGGGKGGDPRLLAPGARRAHHIAGNADDASLLAEEIERLHSLLGQANDPFRRKHGGRSARSQAK
jgi:hypothetical protein